MISRAASSPQRRMEGNRSKHRRGSASSRKESEMSTPVSPRHHDSLKQKVPVARKNVAKEEKMTKEHKMTEIAQPAGKLFAFTIDASTAQVVKLETLDASGTRHELSDEEAASLAQAGAAAR